MKGILTNIAFYDENKGGIREIKGPEIKGVDKKSLKARIKAGEETVQIPLIGEEIER